MNLFVPVVILWDRVMLNRLTDLESIVRAIFDRFNLPSGPTVPSSVELITARGGAVTLGRRDGVITYTAVPLIPLPKI